MKLAKINRGLLALIVLINLYVILLPFYSVVLSFWWQNHVEHRPRQLAQLTKTLPDHPKNHPAEELIIPSIALDEKIVEGPDSLALNHGIWHWPQGSNPGQNGNTVLIGHRWIYVFNGDVAFEHLNLVKTGDNITIVWHGQKFSYTVSGIEVVKPSDISVVRQTRDKRLTLYTCTPMWVGTHRLVVTAKEDNP